MTLSAFLAFLEMERRGRAEDLVRRVARLISGEFRFPTVISHPHAEYILLFFVPGYYPRPTVGRTEPETLRVKVRRKKELLRPFASSLPTPTFLPKPPPSTSLPLSNGNLTSRLPPSSYSGSSHRRRRRQQVRQVSSRDEPAETPPSSEPELARPWWSRQR